MQGSISSGLKRLCGRSKSSLLIRIAFVTLAEYKRIPAVLRKPPLGHLPSWRRNRSKPLFGWFVPEASREKRVVLHYETSRASRIEAWRQIVGPRCPERAPVQPIPKKTPWPSGGRLLSYFVDFSKAQFPKETMGAGTVTWSGCGHLGAALSRAGEREILVPGTETARSLGEC